MRIFLMNQRLKKNFVDLDNTCFCSALILVNFLLICDEMCLI